MQREDLELTGANRYCHSGEHVAELRTAKRARGGIRQRRIEAAPNREKKTSAGFGQRAAHGLAECSRAEAALRRDAPGVRRGGRQRDHSRRRAPEHCAWRTPIERYTRDHIGVEGRERAGGMIGIEHRHAIDVHRVFRAGAPVHVKRRGSFVSTQRDAAGSEALQRIGTHEGKITVQCRAGDDGRFDWIRRGAGDAARVGVGVPRGPHAELAQELRMRREQHVDHHPRGCVHQNIELPRIVADAAHPKMVRARCEIRHCIVSCRIGDRARHGLRRCSDRELDERPDHGCRLVRREDGAFEGRAEQRVDERKQHCCDHHAWLSGVRQGEAQSSAPPAAAARTRRGQLESNNV